MEIQRSMSVRLGSNNQNEDLLPKSSSRLKTSSDTPSIPDIPEAMKSHVFKVSGRRKADTCTRIHDLLAMGFILRVFSFARLLGVAIS